MEFKPLRTVIFFGSVRSPFRLGLRVLKYFEKVLIERKHEVQVIDPLVHKVLFKFLIDSNQSWIFASFRF